MILQKKVVGLSEEALSRFVMRAQRESRLRGRVNVLVTGSAAMRTLNARFRGMNKPTDVLSFPSAQGLPSGRAGFAGEIAISADIAAQSAARLGHSVASEVKVLTLHGILHLAGMDHEHDNGQMARKEAKLRRVLRLPATLTERGRPALKAATSPGPGKGGRTA
ncbi:MAG TPA: rRNA maturation RNase YbeY [Terriglobales bacterium]